MAFQFLLIVRAVEAFVKTTGIKAGEWCFSGFNHRHSDVVIGGFLANQTVQDKAMTVFHYANPQAQFDRDTGFTFTDPFGKWLKQGKDFFGMGNGFPLNSAASNLVNLALGMLAKSVQVTQPYFRNFIVVFQGLATGLRTLKIASCQFNVVLVGLRDLQFFSGFSGFVFWRSNAWAFAACDISVWSDAGYFHDPASLTKPVAQAIKHRPGSG